MRAKKRLSVTEEVTTCVIYTRVSTSEQAGEGVSLAMQEQRCRAFAASRDWEVVQVFEDAGISGTNTDRPALEEMQKFVKARESTGSPTAVITYSLSRLGRSTQHLLELFNSLRVASVTENIDMTTAAGRFMAVMLAAISEFEVDLIRERTVNALVQVKAEGRRVGRPPFGWRVDAAGRLEPDRIEYYDDELGAPLIKGTWVTVDGIIRRHRAGMSKAYIARFFDLHPKQVQRILDDERNIQEFERTNT